MAVKKNRVIRADDALWMRVEREALRRNERVPEFVRAALDEAAETPLCFSCGAPATYRGETPLSRSDDATLEELMALIGKGRPMPERKYSPVRLVFYACALHEDGANDAVMDADGRCSGQNLIRSTCEDPWHFDEAAYSASLEPPENMGNGWTSQGYRCPTCGFRTASKRTSVSHDDPAYVQMQAALDSLGR